MYIRMNWTKRESLRLYLLLTALLFFLSAGIETLYAASFYVGANGGGSGIDGCDSEPEVGNIFARDGLIAVASDSCSWDLVVQPYPTDTPANYSGASNASSFGSDTSLSARLIEALNEVSVEPMADAMAQTSCSGGFYYIRATGAGAGITVTHRVGERPSNPIPPGTPNLDAILNNIQIQVKYRIDAKVNGPCGSVTGTFGISGCGIEDGYVISSPANIDSVWSATVRNGCLLYITASASASACVMEPGSSSAQVSVDPFLQINPDWEYAQYFVAEQESLLVPGEWKEVTRDWKYFCECDLEPDGDVDGSNLYAFMQDFGRTDCSGGCPGDLNGDGKVNEDDLVLFAGDFGKVNCK